MAFGDQPQAQGYDPTGTGIAELEAIAREVTAGYNQAVLDSWSPTDMAKRFAEFRRQQAWPRKHKKKPA